MIWSAALVLVIGIGVVAWIYFSRLALKPSLPPMTVVPFTSFPGLEFNPAFSPDGNQIAFSWNGENGDNFDIYVKQIGSERQLRLTSDPAEDTNPVWSPDGQRIAFLRKSETEVAIFTVATLGGAERKLVSLGQAILWHMRGLAWSSDGKLIACVGNEQPSQIFLFTLDSLEKRTLTAPPAQSVGDMSPVFSPDSQTLAFLRVGYDNAAPQIYVQPIAGGEPRRLTFDNKMYFSWGLDWTADGREIVFSSNRAGRFSLWKVPASGGAPERLAVAADNVRDLCVSHRGHRLAFSQGVADPNMYRIELSGSSDTNGALTKFASSTQGESTPQFSPDGKRIAFESDRSGSYQVWLCDADGSNLIQLTSSEAEAGTPRWSPDGRQIVFDARRERDRDIYVIDVEGGVPRRITTEPSEEVLPSWSSDGKWIYFSSNRTGDWQIWKTPTLGGEAVQVTRQGGFFAFESPSGKFIYYTKNVNAVVQIPGIWRIPAEGGEEALVLGSYKTGYLGEWAVVNDGIYFIDPDVKDDAKNRVAIEFFDFATKQIKRIAGLGKPALKGHTFAVSPDHRRFIYGQLDGGTADIMLVENFR